MLGKSKLELIINLLFDLKMINSLNLNSWHYRISSNNSLNLYFNKHLSFHIKFGNKLKLNYEYHSLNYIINNLNIDVPNPYGLFELNNEYILITKGRLYHPIYLTNNNLKKKQFTLLLNFFNESHSKFTLNQNLNFIEEIQLPIGLKQPFYDYPKILQHGDLAMTNIGLTKKSIIVFDWEDYGKIQIPMFDLTIFFLSLFQFSVKNFFSVLLNSTNRINNLILKMIKTYNLTINDYQTLIPYYLKIFIYVKIKLGYGKKIIDLSSTALTEAESILKKGF